MPVRSCSEVRRKTKGYTKREHMAGSFSTQGQLIPLTSKQKKKVEDFKRTIEKIENENP